MNALSPIAADRRAVFGASVISPEQPAGTDARGSAEFDTLDTEIRKIDTDGPNAVDWKRVAETGLDVIERQSKDLLVGVWVAFALFRREGLGGFATGLAILEGMVSAHWADAFPPARRERARVAAFEWLVGRITPSFADQAFGAGDAPHLVAIQDSLNRIDDECSARLTKESVSFGELIRALRPHADQARRTLAEAVQREDDEARRREAEAAALAAAQEAAVQAAAAIAAAPRSPPEAAQGGGVAPSPAVAVPIVGGASAGVPVSPADQPVSPDTLPELLWSQARALSRQNLGNPHAYVLGRTASWLRIEGLPASENGRTLVMAPPGLEAIEAALRDGQIEAALAAAEELVWTSPFALDAHRQSCELLDKLGPSFRDARAAVIGMLNFFARRFPDATTLLFSDGRPFADPATRDLVAAAPAGPRSRTADPMGVAIGQARGLMGQGKALEALDVLSEPVRRATGRQRVQWQVAQAEFCLEQGFVAAALPLLDHLDRVVEERGLEAWEPELACAVTALRMRALVHPETQMALLDDRRLGAIEATRGRLVRLDIGAAIRLLHA